MIGAGRTRPMGFPYGRPIGATRAPPKPPNLLAVDLGSEAPDVEPLDSSPEEFFLPSESAVLVR